MQRFVEDAGGSSSDEYRIASEITEAVAAKDFSKLLTISKKPIFTFLETEIVKAFKKAIMNPPAAMSGVGPIIGATGKNEEKSQ